MKILSVPRRPRINLYFKAIFPPTNRVRVLEFLFASFFPAKFASSVDYVEVGKVMCVHSYVRFSQLLLHKRPFPLRGRKFYCP